MRVCGVWGKLTSAPAPQAPSIRAQRQDTALVGCYMPSSEIFVPVGGDGRVTASERFVALERYAMLEYARQV
jgi:hypothetical protein